MAYSVLQITGLGCVVFCFLSIAKCLFDTIYTYAIGPVVNKVNFKDQGKWACEYL